MRQKLAQFMAGRYGNDQLNRFISVISLVLMIAAIVLNGTRIGRLFWAVALVLLALVYVRMFSRNMYKRSDENSRYLRYRYKLTSKLRMIKERWVQRKDYKFFTCPSCKTVLRVPKGKGKINIVCRKCGNSFQGKT